MSQRSINGIRGFLFDLDGTLIDSKMDLVTSVNRMLREMGREELPTETVASYVGHGAPRLVASALGENAPEADRRKGLELFLAFYEAHKLDETVAYPGVERGLQALEGLPLAVLTNKPRKLSVDILDGLGLAKYFRAVYGGDSFATKKPDPEGAIFILRELRVDSAAAAMVGDSDVDIQTARNAGMFAVAVKYGFGKHDAQKQAADLYIDSVLELVTTRHYQPR